MKRLTIWLILLVVVMSLNACNKKDDTDLGQPEEPQQEPEDLPKDFLHQYPLTGFGTDENVEYRAFGVMIENSKAARPQSGLYQADLVYEILSEATITRFLAFFHSEKPEVIGPVRSAREYYIHLNNGYNGIYLSAGGSPQAKAMIENREVDHINGLTFDGKFLWRSSDRKAPHNMYTSYDNLQKAAEYTKNTLLGSVPQLTFLEDDEEVNGEPSSEISIKYGSGSNNVVYKYDQAKNHYIRFVGDEQSIDKETKSPIAINNIFIVETSHKVTDKSGRREIDITSGGNGLLFQNGVYQHVQWENVNGQILPVRDGERIGLVKGKTWINVVPELDQSVSVAN
jgi:hypothetical protein